MWKRRGGGKRRKRQWETKRIRKWATGGGNMAQMGQTKGGGGVNVKQRDNKKQKNKYSSSASLLKFCPINGNLRQLIRSLI